VLVDCTLVASILGVVGAFLPVLSLLIPFKGVNGIWILHVIVFKNYLFWFWVTLSWCFGVLVLDWSVWGILQVVEVRCGVQFSRCGCEECCWRATW